MSTEDIKENYYRGWNKPERWRKTRKKTQHNTLASTFFFLCTFFPAAPQAQCVIVHCSADRQHLRGIYGPFVEVGGLVFGCGEVKHEDLQRAAQVTATEAQQEAVDVAGVRGCDEP